MRIRDILIVLLSVIAFIITWYQEGPISIRPGFSYPLSDADSTQYYVPAPTAVDLDGDSHPETILFPQRDYIAILPTSGVQRSHQGAFIPVNHQYLAKLAGNCIGYAAGHLVPVNRSNKSPSLRKAEKAAASGKTTTAAQSKGPKKHIAVLTDDYELTLFSHDLQLVWQTPVIPYLSQTLVPYHATVTIMPQRVYADDVGMVVVSVKTAGPNGTEVLAYAAFNGDDGELRWRHHTDPYVGAAETGTRYEDVSKLRFSQHELAEHSNTVDWTHFRESVVGTMPHRWDHVWHSALTPFAFFRPKGRGKQATGEHRDGSPPNRAKYKDHHQGARRDDYGELGERYSSLRHHQTTKPHREPTPNVLVSQRGDGLEVIHLYTGRLITKFGPLRKGVSYHDVDDDFHIDAVGFRTGSAQKFHSRHGVDQVLECLGYINSGAPVASDPLFNASICDSEGLFSAMSLVSHYIHGDEPHSETSFDPLSLIGSKPRQTEWTSGVMPIVVQHQYFKGNGIYKILRDAVFMIDSGIVTSLSSTQKRVLWKVDTEAFFKPLTHETGGEASGYEHSMEEEESRIRRYPHLAVYRFHEREHHVGSAKWSHRGNDPVILAVGDHMLVALNSKTGVVERSVPLPEPPIAPIVITDFNGDGTNDLILLTPVGYYGFLVYNKNSGSIVSMLMLLMLGLLALLFVAQYSINLEDPEFAASESSGESHPHRANVVKAKYKRSTD